MSEYLHDKIRKHATKQARRNHSVFPCSSANFLSCGLLGSLKPRPNDCNMPTQHIATLLGATCCLRLATVLQHVARCWVLLAQIWPFSNLSQQHPTCRNTSQHGGQTHATCCAQQCCDMLGWQVAIVWPGLKITTTAMATGTSLNKRLHVRYKSLYISLPSSAKQKREMTNSALSEEREVRQLIFLKFCFKFIVVSQIQFRESFDSDKQSKWPKSIPTFVGKI